MSAGDRNDGRLDDFANGRPPAPELAALQAALLPATVPVLPRVSVGARYLLADVATAAGGDWFDAVVRPDGSLGLVVGDVVGHGVTAAVAMGQLRAVARHCLDSAASPAAVLTDLDHFARRSDDARSATVCVAVLQPATGALSFSTAGHPPPLLITAAGHRYLTAAGSAPLATRATYREATAHMAEGDLLLLYTDGIVERPGTHPSAGCADLADVAARAAAHGGGRDDLPSPQVVCDETLALLGQVTGYRDDVTLLAVRRHQPVGRFELSLPDTPLAVTTTRAALDTWLAAQRVDDLTSSAIQHAVGEVVTNAVEHAYAGRPGGAHTVSVHVGLTESGIAEIVVADRGRWQQPVDRPYRGMGLTMAGALVDDVRIDRRESGTTVRLRHRLSRPVAVSTRSADTPVAAPEEEPFLAALTSDDPDAILVVHGPVDAAGAAELRDQLRYATGNGTVSRTVDLSRVTLLASAAVHVLHEAQDRSAGNREHLHLLAPRGSPAHHVLELVGLHPIDHL